MPHRSARRPMAPPSASISRTRWPLPRPPIAGLHDMRAIASRESVTIAVFKPIRADASAASQPAGPAPMTTASWFTSFPDAEGGEDSVIQLVRADLSRDLADTVQRVAEIEEDRLVREPRVRRRVTACERRDDALQGERVTDVRQRGATARS